MDHDLFRFALLATGAVLFYAVFSRGLFNAAEPLRWRALEIAEKLAHSEQVSEKRKKSLNRRLGELHSSWNAWKLVFSLVLLLFKLPFLKLPEDVDAGVPQHLRAEYNMFKVYWVFSTIANSPAATFFFSLIALVVAAFFASLSAISRALAVAQDRHDHHHNAAT